MPRAGAVELGQPGEEHGADGDVDPHTEGVGAADDLQQTVLRQLLDETAVLRQHARVVDADTVPDETRERLAESGGEPEAAQRFGDGVLLLARTEVDAGQGLRAFEGCGWVK